MSEQTQDRGTSVADLNEIDGGDIVDLICENGIIEAEIRPRHDEDPESIDIPDDEVWYNIRRFVKPELSDEDWADLPLGHDPMATTQVIDLGGDGPPSVVFEGWGEKPGDYVPIRDYGELQAIEKLEVGGDA